MIRAHSPTMEDGLTPFVTPRVTFSVADRVATPSFDDLKVVVRDLELQAVRRRIGDGVDLVVDCAGELIGVLA